MVDGPRELDCPERRQVRGSHCTSRTRERGRRQPGILDEPEQRRLRGAGAPWNLDSAAKRPPIATPYIPPARPSLSQASTECAQPSAWSRSYASMNVSSIHPAAGRVGAAAHHLSERAVHADLEPRADDAASATAGRRRPGSPRAPAETTRRACRRPHRKDSRAGMRRAACRLEVGPERPHVVRMSVGGRARSHSSVAARSARDESARWQPSGAAAVSTLGDDGKRRTDRGGKRPIGGGAPVVVQSMTLTKTHDVEATVPRSRRSSRPDANSCAAPFPRSRTRTHWTDRSPLADPRDRGYPFQRLARIAGIEAGVAAVRSIRATSAARKVELVVNAAKKAGIAMRIGANSGSLPAHLQDLARRIRPRRWSLRRSRRSSCSRSSTTATSRSRSRRPTCRR